MPKRSPLSDTEREQIYQLADEGCRGYQIAAAVGRSPSAVSDTLVRRPPPPREALPATYQHPGHHWSWPDPDGEDLPPGVAAAHYAPSCAVIDAAR